jgi:hypothetical protein
MKQQTLLRAAPPPHPADPTHQEEGLLHCGIQSSHTAPGEVAEHA